MATSGFKLTLCRALSGKKRVISFTVLVLFIALLIFIDRNNIFTLNVTTEKTVFTITDPLLSEWAMGGANFLDDPEKSEDDRHTLSGDTILLIEPGTEVEVIRHGIQATGITLRRNDNSPSVGTLTNDNGDDVRLGTWASFLVKPLMKPLILPFRGYLTVGDDVTVGVTSVLLSGHISIIEEQLLGDGRYTAGNETLDSGDRIQIWGEDSGNMTKRSPAIMDGFIRIEPTDQSHYTDAQNAMLIVAHGEAAYVEIIRLGSAGYRISAPVWARLQDPLLALFATLGTLFLAFSEIWSKVKKHFLQ